MHIWVCFTVNAGSTLGLLLENSVQGSVGSWGQRCSEGFVPWDNEQIILRSLCPKSQGPKQRSKASGRLRQGWICRHSRGGVALTRPVLAVVCPCLLGKGRYQLSAGSLPCVCAQHGPGSALLCLYRSARSAALLPLHFHTSLPFIASLRADRFAFPLPVLQPKHRALPSRAQITCRLCK